MKFTTWLGISGKAIFSCEECGALVADEFTDTHADYHAAEGVGVEREPVPTPGFATSENSEFLHQHGGYQRIGGKKIFSVTECGVMIEPNYWDVGEPDELDYSRQCQKCFPSNFKCLDGNEHMWPPELEGDARCELCGLAYGQWSE